MKDLDLFGAGGHVQPDRICHDHHDGDAEQHRQDQHQRPAEFQQAPQPLQPLVIVLHGFH